MDHHRRLFLIRCFRVPSLLGAACGLTLVMRDASLGATVTRPWPYAQRLGPLRVHADYEPMHGELFDELLAMFREIPQRLQLRPAEQPLHLFLFRDRTAYRRYLNHYFPSVFKRRALYIRDSGRSMVFAYAHPALGDDLRHETTHAILHGSAVEIPVWLDEGLAEYFEPGIDVPVESSPHCRAVRSGRVCSLEDLEALQNERRMTLAHYRDAWAWVCFFLRGPINVRRMFLDYLQALQRGSPEEPSLSDQLRRAGVDSDSAIVSYLRQLRNR